LRDVPQSSANLAQRKGIALAGRWRKSSKTLNVVSKTVSASMRVHSGLHLFFDD
jgi:hypothetical protein